MRHRDNDICLDKETHEWTDKQTGQWNSSKTMFLPTLLGGNWRSHNYMAWSK